VIVDALEDMKGQNIVVCDTSGITDLFDRVIVATGTSNRQTRALAKNVHDKVKQNGGEVFGSEGEDTGEWVLVDCGDAVVHILQPAVRDYYRLEDIWGEKQIAATDLVRPKKSATKTKASAAPKKAGAKKSAAKKR
jgi:ribosome-associated protein